MTEMKKFFAAMCFLALAAPVWAQDETRLPEVTVTATRLEQQVIKIPQQVTVIEREQIESMRPNNVLDVLRYVPGVIVRDFSGTGITAKVDMRGFGESADRHVVVMLDGRRLNPIDMSGVDFSTIAVDAIERIEVLHGASSVLYGDGAIGGVINIISREGAGKPASTIEVRGGSYQYGQVRATTKGSEDMFSWFGQAHYGGGRGYRDNNESRTRGAGLNLRLDPSDTASFLLDADYGEANYSLPGALTEAEMEIDRRSTNTPYDWASRQVFDIRGQGRKDMGQIGVLTTDIYYRYLQADSEMVSYYGSPQYQSITHNFGIQPKHIVEYSLFGLGARTTMGIDYNFWKVSSDTIPTSGFATQNEYFANTIAGYLLEEVNLTEKLLLSFGGRLHYATFDIDQKAQGMATDSQTASETQYAWTTGLTYNFIENAKVYASAGRTFRYPLVDEYVTWGMFNPDLEAEYGMNYELGAAYTLPFGLTLDINLYWLALSNEIAYNNATNMNENLDDTRHRGVNLNLSMPLGERNQHLLFASAGYQEAVFDGGQYDGKEMPLVPQWTASAGARVELIENLRVNGRINFIGSRYFDGDRENQFDKMSAYATVDLGADYTWENLTVFFNVQNLFNKYYSEYGINYGLPSYYPAPGTLFWGGVIVKF